jgi:uncharacterized protein (TIGR03435 family)
MTKRRGRWAFGIVIISMADVPAAQTPSSPAFEVASVKPAKQELRLQKPMFCTFPARGRFLAFGDLRWLIACAYAISPARRQQEISGGPEWIGDELFAIEAKSAADDTPALTVSLGLLMVRALLADRFGLIVHTETKEMPVHSLVLARRDGRLGPQLRPTPPDCAAWLAARGRPGAPPRPPVSGDRPCGVGRVGRSILARSGITLSQLAELLSSRVNRVVRDRTGLAGYFDLDLQWTPEQNTAVPADAPFPAFPAVDTTGPSLFTALQEQLGLKLESSKAAVDVLVVYHAERPTAD